MKTIKSLAKLSSILMLSALLVISCTKKDTVSNEDLQSSASSNAFTVSEMKSTTSTPTGVSFCSVKTVPLCSDGNTIGSVEVKKGSDNKVYVTYSANSGWYLAQVSLFAGLTSAIPDQLSDFANRKTFGYPFADQSYSFTLSGLPNSFTVVAYAILVKKTTSGLITGIKVAWGDGCTGKDITCSSSSGYRSGCSSGCDNEELVGGSYFTYSAAACVVPPPPAPPAPTPVQVSVMEPDICSQNQGNFFGIHPDYGCIIPWSEPVLNIAGYSYTEAEARAIADAPDVLGVTPDAKLAFVRAGTLILSHTDYNASPTVGPAMKTIIDWLSTKGKLSPSNLPTGNVAVRTEAMFLDTWISLHLCEGRR